MAKTSLAIAEDTVPAYINTETSRGNENVGAQLAIPRIKQLQKMSDEVDKHHPKYIEGAEPGMFLNTLSGATLGEDLYVISINFTTEFVVWRTRDAGGGYIGAGATAAEAQALIDAQEDDKGQQVPASNFQITETHSHLMVLKDPKTGELSMPAIFDFANSKLSVSKNWNTQISMKGGDRFAGLWHVSTVAVENRSGATYLNLKIDWTGWAQEEDYKAAEALYQSHA
tara:strand:- start:605 stop:1285 length:681 start_codon:yes stop_codon:yes gene_type:complete